MENVILIALAIGVPLGLFLWLCGVLINFRTRWWAKRKARAALAPPRPPRSRFAPFKL
jgi:hypothetical protein